MSLRSLGHLFEPERILWVGPDGPAARWVRIAEANLWDAGFAGTIHALRSTGRAPEAARLDRLAPLAQEPCLAIVCLPQADLPALIDGLAGIGSRAVSGDRRRSRPGRPRRRAGPCDARGGAPARHPRRSGPTGSA